MKTTRASVTKAYKDYKVKYPRGHKRFLTNKEFVLIIKRLGEELAYSLITSGKMITLPERLGRVQAVKFRTVKKIVDYKKTKDLYGGLKGPKKVYCSSRATKGFMPRIIWEKEYSSLFKNKRKYAFKLTRPNIRINTYNKSNPRVNLMSFFMSEGYLSYEIEVPRNSLKMPYTRSVNKAINESANEIGITKINNNQNE